MNQQQVIEKINKLLNLAQSDNVNEAASATKRAQEMMEKYRIESVMLETSDTVEEDIEDDIFAAEKTKNIATWRWLLADGFAKANGCQIYFGHQDSKKVMRIVGQPGDAAGARYLYLTVSREIERLAKYQGALRGSPGRTWLNSFRLGAVSMINERLKEATAQTRKELRAAASTETALVTVNNAIEIIDARSRKSKSWMAAHLNLRSSRGSGSRHDSGGYSAGRKAGAGIGLASGKSRGYLGS